MDHRKAQITTMANVSFKVLALAVAIAACLPAYAATIDTNNAQEAAINFDIAAGDLSTALERFSTQSGIQVLYQEELVVNRSARGIKGMYEPSLALSEMLKDTNLVFEFANSRTYVLKRKRSAPTPARNKPSHESAGSREELGSEIGELEKVFVVGSRLRTNPTDSALPIKVISRQDIEQSGASTIAQMLGYLPEVSMNNFGDTNIGPAGGTTGGLEGNEINAATVQMRGLPLGTTLILINGRRSGESSALASSGQFDLNTIPLSMVERIEVLPAGSSALYGGDGLAGVVNIVLRRDGSGLEVTINNKQADGYDESTGSVLWGKSWSRGSITATMVWKKNSALNNAEREITSSYDFTRYGGLDYRSAGYSYPATIYSLDGCDMSLGFCALPLAQRGNLPGLNFPVAIVPVGQNGQNLVPSDFAETQGQVNLSTPEYNIYSPGSSRSLGINGEFNLKQDVKLIAEAMYSGRSISARQIGLGINNGQYGFASAVVTADNPFNPFGVDVGIDYTFSGSNIFREYKQDYIRTLFGIAGTSGGLDWEVTSWWSRDKSSTGNHLSFASYYYASALGATDPTMALNPFTGDGSPPGSDQLLSGLAVPMTSEFGVSTLGMNAFVRGSIFNLPAGKVLAVLGGEYTKQKLLQEVSVAVDNISGNDVNRALFGEIRVPILAAKNGNSTYERLVATGAMRVESTTRFERNATTEMLGLELRPSSNILLRATYSTAFKPITIYHGSSPVGEFSTYVQDPALAGEMYLVPRIIYGGGIPDGLKPEQSTSKTIGVVYTPTANWRLSITSWEIDVGDLLHMSPWPELVLENEVSLPGRVARDPISGFATSIDTRPFNISAVNTAGYDISLDARRSTANNSYSWSTAASRVVKHDQRFSDSSPVLSNLGVVKSTGWSPDWKIVQRLGWSYRDDAHVTVVGRYVSSYDDPVPLYTGPNAGSSAKLGDLWMFDVNVDLAIGRWLSIAPRLFAGTRLKIGGTNIFNKLPEFCNSCRSPVGYDASQYDILGRAVYAELRVQLQ